MINYRIYIKVLYLLCAAIIACSFQNSYPMYGVGLRSVWQRYVTSMRNIYARPFAFNRSFSTFLSPGLMSKRAPLFRTSALLQNSRFLSTEMKEKLLERIRMASNQGDIKTVEQTMKFIEQNVPDIKQLAQQATKEPITQKTQSGSEFAHNPFEQGFYEDAFADFIKRQQRYKAYSPLDQVENRIERSFKEHAKHKTHVMLNNNSTFPSATWKEWLTRDYNSYMDRVYAWIFDENNLKFTFEPLSPEQKESLLNEFRHYIKTERSKKDAFTELEDLIAKWDPVCGHMCNEPETTRTGIYLFGDIYNEAIKANAPLMESITKNVSYFTPTNDDQESSYVARKLIRKHLQELVEFYRKELNRLLKKELSTASVEKIT